jgi:hypothetical protein
MPLSRAIAASFLAGSDAPHDDIAIGDHPDQPPVFDHGQATDIPITHHGGCRRQPGIGPDDCNLPLHDVPDQQRPPPRLSKPFALEREHVVARASRAEFVTVALIQIK